MIKTILHCKKIWEILLALTSKNVMTICAGCWRNEAGCIQSFCSAFVWRRWHVWYRHRWAVNRGKFDSCRSLWFEL